MSEPCKHEREFAGTQADTLTSFIKTSGALVKMTAERDALRVQLLGAKNTEDDLCVSLAKAHATIEANEVESDQIIDRLAAGLRAKDATIERVRALLGDRDGPLWAVRGVREADIRAALEPTDLPKGMKA